VPCAHRFLLCQVVSAETGDGRVRACMSRVQALSRESAVISRA
jgi:hypothetical protein